MFKVSCKRLLVACLVLVAGALILYSAARPVVARTNEQGSAVGPAHYTVVMTEGHNLLVTDNAANKVYFYTIDKDKPIGSPLKLRASVDLTKVGDEEIHITAHNVEKVDK
jgi:hypothetical protein